MPTLVIYNFTQTGQTGQFILGYQTDNEIALSFILIFVVVLICPDRMKHLCSNHLMKAYLSIPNNIKWANKMAEQIKVLSTQVCSSEFNEA